MRRRLIVKKVTFRTKEANRKIKNRIFQSFFIRLLARIPVVIKTVFRFQISKLMKLVCSINRVKYTRQRYLQLVSSRPWV